MTLEFNGRQRDLTNIATSNITASGDPNQFRHDLNDQLIKAASLAGAARSQGFSDDETIAKLESAKRRQLRDRQRDNRENREVRDANEAAALAFLAEDDKKYDIKGTYGVEEDYPDPFGGYEEVIRDDTGRIIETRIAQDDFQDYTRDELVDNQVLGDDFLTGDEKSRMMEGRSRVKSGLPGVRDALALLNQASSKYGYDAFPGLADAETRLEDDIEFGKNQRAVEAELTRRMVAADRARVNPKNAEAVRDRAAAVAEKALADRQSRERAMLDKNPRNVTADEVLARLGIIESLGTAKGVDKEGQMSRLKMVNDPSPSQMLNAPESVIPYQSAYTRGEDFVVRNLPDYSKEGGGNFEYPQVDVGSATQQFTDRVRAAKLGFTQLADLRSIDEFSYDMAAIAKLAGLRKDPLTERNEETGKPVPVNIDSVDSLLGGLGYNEKEKKELANALLQLDMAANTSVNQEMKQRFADRIASSVIGSMPDTLGETEYSRIGKLTGNEKIKAGDKRISVRAALKGLTDKDAQLPFIGVSADSERPRASFIKGENRGKSVEELIEKYGPVRGPQAAGVEARYLADGGEIFIPKGTSQPIRPLDVPPSIAPDPAAAAPRMSGDMLNILAELNSGEMQGPSAPPQQGPVQPMQPRKRTAEEIAARFGNKMKGYATSPRFQRGRRIGYGIGGGLAGLSILDSMINDERDQRQGGTY